MSQLRTNSIVPLDGLPVGASGGGIVQVVQTVKTDPYVRTSSSGDMAAITGLSATITPSSTSSKILILAMLTCGGSTSQRWYIEAYRNGSQLTDVIGDSDGSNRRETTTVAAALSGDTQVSTHYKYLDSPATTSAVTYQMYGGIEGNNTFTVNRSQTDTDSIAVQRTASTLILMEVTG